MSAPRSEPSNERVGNLRGAGVDVDMRRLGQVVAGVCLVALVVAVVVLVVAGMDKNAQITRLRTQGVPVEVTVTGCLGQLGGSGSNAAGYSCRGTFTLEGHRYDEDLPGDTLLPPGTMLRGVTVPGDPALVSTPGAVAAEHTSRRVFILPIVLVVAAVLVGGVLLLRRRRSARVS